MRVRCPKCKKDVSLWRGVEVTGWQAISADMEVQRGEHEVEWSTATPDGTVGCGECQWNGLTRELERLGIDGEPLAPPLPGQEALEV